MYISHWLTLCAWVSWFGQGHVSDQILAWDHLPLMTGCANAHNGSIRQLLVSALAFNTCGSGRSVGGGNASQVCAEMLKVFETQDRVFEGGSTMELHTGRIDTMKRQTSRIEDPVGNIGRGDVSWRSVVAVCSPNTSATGRQQISR